MKKKLIIIKDISDKIKSEIDVIIEKGIENVLIILISNILEKNLNFEIFLKKIKI